MLVLKSFHFIGKVFRAKNFLRYARGGRQVNKNMGLRGNSRKIKFGTARRYIYGFSRQRISVNQAKRSVIWSAFNKTSRFFRRWRFLQYPKFIKFNGPKSLFFVSLRRGFQSVGFLIFLKSFYKSLFGAIFFKKNLRHSYAIRKFLRFFFFVLT